MSGFGLRDKGLFDTGVGQVSAGLFITGVDALFDVDRLYLRSFIHTMDPNLLSTETVLLYLVFDPSQGVLTFGTRP